MGNRQTSTALSVAIDYHWKHQADCDERDRMVVISLHASPDDHDPEGPDIAKVLYHRVICCLVAWRVFRAKSCRPQERTVAVGQCGMWRDRLPSVRAR